MVAPNPINSTEGKLGLVLEARQGKVILSLPVTTVSEANGGVKKSFVNKAGKTCYKNEHWRERNDRHKLQKRMVYLALNPVRNFISFPCHVKITRLAPKKVDRWDNLPYSVKWILDSVCAILTGDFRPGRADDDDEKITVSYDQFVNKDYFVIIEITN